jgi:predicted DNA-binding transcriptional regulator AlpA
MNLDVLAKEFSESISNSTLLSVGDVKAAQLLGISRAGLHRFVRRGLVPRPFKLGRRSLYRVADLRACIDRLAAP